MTFLFVPGFMADRTLWTELVGHLGDAPVAFADMDRGESIEEMATMALARAPDEYVLVGFSMGGYVARAMARLAPERARALILIATSARADTPEQSRRKAAAAAQLESAPAFSGLSRTSILSSLHKDRAHDEALIGRVRAMGVRLGKSVFLRQSTIPRDTDMSELFQIQCPTLVVAAREDRLRKLDEALELKNGIKESKLAIIEASGHMVPLEAPKALARTMLNWLSEQSIGGANRSPTG